MYPMCRHLLRSHLRILLFEELNAPYRLSSRQVYTAVKSRAICSYLQRNIQPDLLRLMPIPEARVSPPAPSGTTGSPRGLVPPMTARLETREWAVNAHLGPSAALNLGQQALLFHGQGCLE